jgi:hypothetical protein
MPTGTDGFTLRTKEGVLRIFIAFINPSPRPGLNPRPLGLVERTLTTGPSWATSDTDELSVEACCCER